MLTQSIWRDAKAAAKAEFAGQNPPALGAAPTLPTLWRYERQAVGKFQAAYLHADKAVCSPYQWQRDEHRGYAVSALTTAIITRLLVRRARRAARIERAAA